MAPILFLFLTQAMMVEALEAEWTSVRLTYPTFRPDEKMNQGRLLGGQSWKTKGKPFKLYYLLYLDNWAFIFTKHRGMIKVSCFIITP